MYKLVVTSWENDDEYGQGGNLETKDRYFGSLSEVLERSNDIGLTVSRSQSMSGRPIIHGCSIFTR